MRLCIFCSVAIDVTLLQHYLTHELSTKHYAVKLCRSPNAHTEEIKWIRYNHRHHLKILVCELYGKLRSNKEYSRHPNSLYDMYGHLSYSSAAPSIKKMCNPQLYDILTKLGAKYTLDVKYIPA